MPGKIPPELNELHDTHLISHLDYYFALSMARVFPKESGIPVLSCALVSKALAEGHVCIDIRDMAGRRLDAKEPAGGVSPRLPDRKRWGRALKESDMVGKTTPPADPARFPLILEKGRFLYLSKYYDLQVRLADTLAQKIRSKPLCMATPFLTSALESAFKDQNPTHTKGQKKAVANALQHGFSLISGGPGTGKTYITRILRQILHAYHKQMGLDDPVFINLAPTGKAAARLDQGATIHSVLKPKKGRPGFIHGKQRPIQGDVVIIDEASMIDLALMTRLLEAIPETARVILLGDENQLPPVQAGAVFRDICAIPALKPCITFLDHNFRSEGKTGIEKLSRAVMANDADKAVSILTQGAFPDLCYVDTGTVQDRDAVLAAFIRGGYAHLLQCRDVPSCLEAVDRFKILCAHNSGELGTLQINHLCEKLLQPGSYSGITDRFFRGMVMIRVNDYPKMLFNGDTGVVSGRGQSPRAYFAGDDEGTRTFRLPDLPPHDPAYAVTVHKAQGSEFDTVVILVPDTLTPVVTRQLLYTGITRARQKAVIMGPMAVIRSAIGLSQGGTSNLSCAVTEKLSALPEKEGGR